MTQDEIIEMAQECNLIGMRPYLDGIYSEALVTFANLVAAKERENWPVEMKAMENQVNILTDELAKATEEANARANASWTLMCKKMVDIEREACAKVCDEVGEHPSLTPQHCAESIRARGEQA